MKQNSSILRKNIIYVLTAIILLSLAIFLIYSLRSLILPTIIGILAAYIFAPGIDLLRKTGMPRGVAIILLFGIFVFSIIILVKYVSSIIPDEKGKLVMRVRIQYKINEKYKNYMGIDSEDEKGNVVYNFIGKDLNKIIVKINQIIGLNPEEIALFNSYIADNKIEAKYIKYYKAVCSLSNIEHNGEIVNNPKKHEEGSRITAIVDILSTWLVLPFVFLFLIIDDGDIKRYFVSLVPNRYFEMTLTIFEKVDDAIGNYLRGTVLECSLVGLTFIILLPVIGFEFKVAVLIGVVAGIANAIPFLGPLIGLIISLGYALIIENSHSILPFINENNRVIWVFLVVLIAQAMDNAVYQPIVLGKAVNLHPLVVIFGVMGGSILFGFAGMLLAVPTIVILKVIIFTFFEQMKAYYII